MGEKGNLVDAAALAPPGADSLVERVTTTTTQTVLQAGEDLATTIRDKTIDKAADATIAETRERLHRTRGDQPGSRSDEPPPGSGA